MATFYMALVETLMSAIVYACTLVYLFGLSQKQYLSYIHLSFLAVPISFMKYQ